MRVTLWCRVGFEDTWWLCADTTVKGASPPPTPPKATSLVQAQANQFVCTRHVTVCLPTNKGFSPPEQRGCPEHAS